MQTLDVARRRFLLGIFVVSGFTGLIYESVWSQYLKLFLGHAAYAQTVVLSMFMGGMALGSWIAARYGGRLRHLLWGYLLVEAVIGIFGILFHRLYTTATDFTFAQVIPALHSGLAIHAYKWSLAALLVLPQSVLLGMTFPLISGGIIRRWPDRAGETLSTLYFTNSLGAALGVLVSGFVLISLVGLPGTTLTAGLLNVLLALAVWLVVRRQSEPVAQAPAVTALQTVADPVARWFVVAAFLTGTASFMYELGWIRMLSLVLGSSTHSFELMLSAFIFGLAFGGLYVRRRIERITDPELYLGGIMVTMGVLAALTVPASNMMYDVMEWTLGTFTRTPNGYVGFNAVSQIISMLIMVPATFCAGMTLPLLTYALMRRGAGEKAIGTIYSVNTLGAIAGVFITVHLLLTWIGVKGVILTGAGIHLALGLSRLFPRALRKPLPAAALAASVAAFTLLVLFGGLDPMRVGSGVYRTAQATLPADATVAYLRDGKTATITLIKKEGNVIISTNGKPDAAIRMGHGEPSDDEITMVLLAALPLSLRPEAVRVANIGFGSGLTTHTLLASPHITRLDSIEIEPKMVEAARQGFGPRIHDVFEDPRSHIAYEDAKTFFAASREPYDLVVSEPSNPWVSGVATLFSDEFYGHLVHYMRPNGILVQWIQIYETDLRVVSSIIKALSRHFGAYAIYDLNDIDILIVATPAASLPAPTDHVFQWPQMRGELARVGVQSLADLQGRVIGDQRTIGPFFNVMPVPANSDYFPYVDVYAPELLFESAHAFELTSLTALSAPVLDLLRADPPPSFTPEPSDHSRLARDKHVRTAVAIRRALSSGRLDDLDASGAASVLLVRTNAEQCRDPEVQKTWRRAVQNISAMTASYLNPSELADIWSTIKSTPCYRDTTGEQRVWTDLYTAVAAREPTQIVALGNRLLGSPGSLTPSDLTYLTAVVAAAYIRLNQPTQAYDVLLAHWRRLELGNSDEFSFPIRELRALAQAGNLAALARAAGSSPAREIRGQVEAW
jgi:predicted membrane-bound spermidine synthase